MGKVLLAALDEDELDALISWRGLSARTVRTITAEATLRDELRRIAEQGFALDEEEEEEGVRCVALPVRDRSGRVRAGASVSGPAARFDGIDVAGLAASLRAVVTRMGLELWR